MQYLVILKDEREGESFLRGKPISTDLHSLTAAKGQIEWLVLGGYDREQYAIVKSSPVPGVLEVLGGDNLPVLLEKGFLTNAAFRDLHLKLWGHLV